MIELTQEETIVIQKLREMGAWGELKIIKQNGKIDIIEKSEREKIGIPK